MPLTKIMAKINRDYKPRFNIYFLYLWPQDIILEIQFETIFQKIFNLQHLVHLDLSHFKFRFHEITDKLISTQTFD